MVSVRIREGRKAGRKAGRKEGRKEERKEGRILGGKGEMMQSCGRYLFFVAPVLPAVPARNLTPVLLIRENFKIYNRHS